MNQDTDGRDRAEGADGERRPGAELVPVGRAEVGELVVRLAEEGRTDEEGRARLLGRLSAALARSARAAGARSLAGGRWLTDLFTEEIAPRIPIRDRETLIRHHRGLQGDDLADALERVAANTTTAVGAAGGALAAVQFTAPPLLLTAPAQIVAETLVVAAVEVKLIGELHEVYGRPARGGMLQRTSGYLVSWARRRGIDPTQNAESLTVALGTAARTALRNRLMKLLGRHLSTLGPYLTGAVAGGTLNRSGTRTLARAVRADLRSTAAPGSGGGSANVLPLRRSRPLGGRG